MTTEMFHSHSRHTTNFANNWLIYQCKCIQCDTFHVVLCIVCGGLAAKSGSCGGSVICCCCCCFCHHLGASLRIVKSKLLLFFCIRPHSLSAGAAQLYRFTLNYLKREKCTTMELSFATLTTTLIYIIFAIIFRRKGKL